MMDSHTRPLKISILIYSSALWGGMEVHTVELARKLESMGHDVSIVEVSRNFFGKRCLDQGRNISVTYLPTAQPLSKHNLLWYFRIFRNLKGNIFIFPKGNFREFTWYFELAARLLFSRYITIEHLAFEPMPPKRSGRHLKGLLPGIGIWWYKANLDSFLRSLLPHFVVCVSDGVAKILLDHHYFSPSKVTTLRNGIDTERFQPVTDYRMTFRNMWGIPQDALVFGAIGRLHPMKGFDIALELFRQLISSVHDRNVWFVLVGDGPERDALKQLAEEPDIKDKVRIIGLTDKPWEVYPAIDVFVMPSHNEGLPLSLLEAMGCGCCPIAMGVGGIPEVINDPGLGWIVPPNDRHGFFEAMKEAAEIEPDKLRQMGRKIREHIVLNFEASRQFDALANLIEKECRNKLEPQRVSGKTAKV